MTTSRHRVVVNEVRRRVSRNDHFLTVANSKDADWGRTVLWVGEEDGADVARELGAFGADLDEVIYLRPGDLETPEDLQAAARQWTPDVIVVDPMADLLRLADERSYTLARQALARWRPSKVTRERETLIAVGADGEWEPAPTDIDAATVAALEAAGGHLDTLVEAEEVWPAVVGLMHSGKDREVRGDHVGGYLGTVAWGSACDLMLELLQRDRANLRDTRRTLRCCKSRLPDVAGGEVVDLDFVGGRYVRGVSVADRVAKLKAAGLSKRKAAETLDLKPGASKAYREFSTEWGAV